ncbi:MAG TPA: GIY-YIG nuclease family protein [Dyella sp.]|uniref:GIY-YIG nuclease family protein n=1 Tax=Dyella sp. TaxID=1869338 RepID=UPI002D792C6D|nr:GIY-YIG nuclease family protein [Dyella sp.]HET6554479.1 GIY-YIG nuclease family protein [Dyella sp.]
MDEDFVEPRFASRGRAYVYVLPCRDEDLLKIGFTREPMERFRTLNRRFFELFDLGRGLLVEVDRVAQARRIERLLLTHWPEHRAPAPLVVPASAAGHTEWYRGVGAEAIPLARQLAQDEGLLLHEPLRPWLAAELSRRADALYSWSERMLAEAMLEREHAGLVGPGPMEQALLDTLALCESMGLPLADLLPESVAQWYRYGAHRGLYSR